VNDLLKHFQPVEILLAGVVLGQLLAGRSLRRHGERIGKLAARVHRLAEKTGLKDGGEGAGE
jgi:hypothetical protein